MIVTIILRRWEILHYAILLFFVGLIEFIPSRIWNIPVMAILVSLLASTFIIFLFPKTRVTLIWLRYGHLDKISILLMAATSFFAAYILIIWGFWSNNLGIGLTTIKTLSVFPYWVILGVFIPAFALINSFVEEATYRGILQETLSYLFVNNYFLTIAIQASAFAAAHVTHGFPNGKLGYLMTFCYGCLLGYLRHRTKGIFLSYFTHVVADLIIGYFLYLIAF